VPADRPLTVRRITTDEHLGYVAAHADERSISFLQTPSWAAVKAEWSHASLGWFDAEEQLVGAGLVLLRQVPKVKRFLAYLPEGPDIDWTGERTGIDLADWLEPLAAQLKAMGAFAIKMGPTAVVRRWQAETIKAAIAEGTAGRLRDVTPDEADPAALAVVERLGRWAGRASPTPERASATCSRATSSRCRSPVAARPTCSPGSTSCGGATSRRPTRPAWRWCAAASTTCRPSTRSTSRPPSATASPRADWPTSSGCSGP
jgi:hypothetical protein